MGDAADDIINGDCCEICSEYFEDEGPGHPRLCKACKGEKRTRGEGDTGFFIGACFVILAIVALGVLIYKGEAEKNRCIEYCHPYAVVHAPGQCLCADQIRERAK